MNPNVTHLVTRMSIGKANKVTKFKRNLQLNLFVTYSCVIIEFLRDRPIKLDHGITNSYLISYPFPLISCEQIAYFHFGMKLKSFNDSFSVQLLS